MSYRGESAVDRTRMHAIEQELEVVRRERDELRAALEGFEPRRTVLALGVALCALLAAVLVIALRVSAPAAIACVVVLALTSLVASLIRSVVVTVPPGRLLILAGRRSVLPDGSTVGYRLVHAGRTIRTPLIEQAAWLRLAPFTVDVLVRGAYVSDGVLDIELGAIVEIHSDPEKLRRAVERFLGCPQHELARVVESTVEGAVRQLAAESRSTDLQRDRAAFVARLLNTCEDDFDALGLRVVSVKIHGVRDARPHG